MLWSFMTEITLWIFNEMDGNVQAAERHSQQKMTIDRPTFLITTARANLDWLWWPFHKTKVTLHQCRMTRPEKIWRLWLTFKRHRCRQCKADYINLIVISRMSNLLTAQWAEHAILFFYFFYRGFFPNILSVLGNGWKKKLELFVINPMCIFLQS